MTGHAARAVVVWLCLTLSIIPVLAQFTVLDEAQDATATAAAPHMPCGNQPFTIARMSWPSAQLLAEIHARILKAQFGCDVRLTPGELAATASSMGSAGQPAVAPEMWISRIAEVWNAGVAAQQMRQAAPAFVETELEGWFIPDFVARTHPELTSVTGLAAALPTLRGGVKVKFISCPIDWACSLNNRNLIAAYGLQGGFEIVEPANRFEMDSMIAEAVNLGEPIVFYYWQPNAILAQFNFLGLDMGEFDAEAIKCLAQITCATPAPSAFVTEPVVIALSEWVFTDAPQIAAYFQRASMPLAAMNQLLAQLNQPGATVEGVADRFVDDQQAIWSEWASTN